jgi:hypothetical protein
MFFRSSLCQQGLVPNCVGNDHRQVSRLAGELWQKLTPGQKAPFQHAAMLEKSRHQLLYPDYKYSPGSKQSNMTKRTFKTLESAEEWAQRIANLISSGIEGVDLSDAIRRSSLLLKQSPGREDHAHTHVPPSLPTSTSTATFVSAPIPVYANPTYMESYQPSIHTQQYGNESNPIVLDPPSMNIQAKNVQYIEQQAEAFVPTEAIPPLDLCATPTPTINQVCTRLSARIIIRVL